MVYPVPPSPPNKYVLSSGKWLLVIPVGTGRRGAKEFEREGGGRILCRLCPPSVALVQVPTELREFKTLLHNLGVPEKFRPGDYLGVLKDMEVQAKGHPLNSHALGIAVGE